jgi:hypothetical protein
MLLVYADISRSFLVRSAHTDVRFLICALRERIRVEIMVGLGGLEPPTSPLSGARSTHLSYRPKDLRSGGADRDRTGDPRVANAVLSQLSYSPRWDVLFLDMQVSCVGTLGG